MKEWLQSNPVIVNAVITLVVAGAVALGFDLTAEQLLGVLTALGLVAVPVTRAKVTPTRKAQ